MAHLYYVGDGGSLGTGGVNAIKNLTKIPIFRVAVAL